MIQKYRTLDDIEFEYFTNHPKEINKYLKEVLNAYENDSDEGAFLASLKTIAKIKGIKMSTLAEETGLNRESLYKTLSQKGNPTFSTITKIFKSLGYTLKLTPITKQEKLEKVV